MSHSKRTDANAVPPELRRFYGGRERRTDQEVRVDELIANCAPKQLAAMFDGERRLRVVVIFAAGLTIVLALLASVFCFGAWPAVSMVELLTGTAVRNLLICLSVMFTAYVVSQVLLQRSRERQSDISLAIMKQRHREGGRENHAEPSESSPDRP